MFLPCRAVHSSGASIILSLQIEVFRQSWKEATVRKAVWYLTKIWITVAVEVMLIVVMKLKHIIMLAPKLYTSLRKLLYAN